MESTASTRYAAGIALLKEVGGSGYDAPINKLQATAPDLARFSVEFCYGEVMAGAALDLATRELCTVAALAALGHAQPQLSFHIAGALNVGCTPESIVEVLFLCAVFAGFPAAENAVASAHEVFRQRGLACETGAPPALGERFERGMAALEQLSAGAGKAVVASLASIAPDLGRYVIEFSYGDILARPGIDARTKELAIVAMLTALGTAAPQLKVHIGAALNVGVTPAELVAVIEQMAVYAGFPAALNGVFAAKDVLAAREPDSSMV